MKKHVLSAIAASIISLSGVSMAYAIEEKPVAPDSQEMHILPISEQPDVKDFKHDNNTAHPGFNKPEHKRHMVMQMEGLNLSDAQRSELKKIFKEHKKQSADIHQEQKLFSSLISLDPKSKLFDKEVNRIASEAGKLAFQHVIEVSQHRKAMADVLTPEQLKQFDQVIFKKQLRDKPSPRQHERELRQKHDLTPPCCEHRPDNKSPISIENHPKD